MFHFLYLWRIFSCHITFSRKSRGFIQSINCNMNIRNECHFQRENQFSFIEIGNTKSPASNFESSHPVSQWKKSHFSSKLISEKSKPKRRVHTHTCAPKRSCLYPASRAAASLNRSSLPSVGRSRGRRLFRRARRDLPNLVDTRGSGIHLTRGRVWGIRMSATISLTAYIHRRRGLLEWILLFMGEVVCLLFFCFFVFANSYKK